MMRCLAKLLAAALLTLSAAPGLARNEYVYGPKPDWARYKALGEAALKAKLPDADKWTVEWPNGYMPGRWPHKGDFRGYLSCGRLRAIEPTAGRDPVVNFVVVIDHDAVKTADISTKASNSLVNVICAAYVSMGKLPPAQLMETVTPESAPSNGAVGNIGVTIRVMPEGAYVLTVDPGLPGQRAGLVAGTVVTRVNGVALANMGDAMVSVLNSDASSLTLDTASGQQLSIRRTQP